MFGKRDPKQYGAITLDQIDAQLQALGKELGAEVESYLLALRAAVSAAKADTSSGVST